MISINPDAHSTAEIDLVHWGVVMARKGGVPRGKVINAMEVTAFERWLRRDRIVEKRTP
jgi:DNA polymerase (family X)